MCRLAAYKGKSILIGSVVTKPNNSLLYQSRDAAYHPGVKDETHHRNILVNGDGFGVAWYSTDDVSRGSCAFKFVTPAWSNQNLQNIGDHVSSNLIFAHIRAASSGHNPFEKISVSHENCHPFVFGRYTFMHNGGIPHFSKIKLKLLNLLADPFFQEIKGSTDSEHIFALFLTVLYANYPASNDLAGYLPIAPSLDETILALNKTISTLLSLCEEVEIEDACSLNLCLTDGVNIIATRFRNGPQMPPSLYYNYGADFTCDEQGNFYAQGGTKKADSVVISSAPLSKVSALPSLLHPDLNASCEDCSPIGPALYNSDSSSQSSSFSSSSSSSSPPLSPNSPSSPSMDHFVLGEEDIGSWVLMPKDHMLICQGDALNPYKIASIDLKPVMITEPYQQSHAHNNSNNNSKQKKDDSEVETLQLKEKKKEQLETTGEKGLLLKGSSSSSSSGSPKRPRMMRFRSKL
jgi:glutamine amidotransferase